MTRLWSVLVVLAIALACNGKKSDTGPRDSEPVTLTVGMDWRTATARLASEGAEDVSRFVGIKFELDPDLALQEVRWMVVGDNTCIAILGGGASAEAMTVTRILIGATGAGYEDKMSWSQSSREVTAIDLAEHRKAN